MIPEGQSAVVLSPELREGLTIAVRRRFPTKSFGYLISTGDKQRPSDFLLFDGNRRNDAEWQSVFHAFGHYFITHDDAGFVASSEESWRIQKEIWARAMVEVAVFHSHQRHPANFSGVDYGLHVTRFPNLWHLIISMRNPTLPQIRAYGVTSSGVRELTILERDWRPAEVNGRTPVAR